MNAKQEIIALANRCGIDVDEDGDIMGSTNGALLVFAVELLKHAQLALAASVTTPSAYIAESEYPVRQIGIPHPTDTPTVVTLSTPTSHVCDVCADGDCLADNAGLPCPFSVSMKSIDEHDPQSFINDVKWACERIPTAPTPSADARYTMDEMRDYAEAFHRSRVEASAPTAPAQEPLRKAVRAVVSMLKDGEYAEHWSSAEAPGDEDAAALERAITELVNDAHEAAAPTLGETNTDNIAVDTFASAMKEKMADAHDKGRSGWECMTPAVLSRMLREHVEKGDPRDVANYCMMLWHHSARIAAPAQGHGAKGE